MKYLCLIYVNEDALERLPADERRALHDSARALRQQLRQHQRLHASGTVASTLTATTLRYRDERRQIEPGPATEGPVQLAGWLVLEAAHLDEALALAAHLPACRLGAVEVRPVTTAEETP